jgi:metallophosphoesterase superfamily enzyme
VILVKGNHDGGIEEYLDISIIPSSGFEFED